ncbi:MAG: peptidylprolyl isomerase [Acetobacteraceae bacterium]|nr:peptidylprolyl isomerase [Acetobacteraceae bacterium]
MLRKRLAALPVALALAAGLALPLAAQPAPDPIVARVNGEEIRASDLAEAAQALPQDMRGMPPSVIMPMLIDQLVDRKAISLLARQRKFENDPAVLRATARAADQAMQTALMQKEISPLITDAALKARYDRDFAGKPGETEVHARHILVTNEADARAAIAELKAGGDFAAIAKSRSTDPGSADGGDLGFFKQGDMVPEFAAVAFALKPGETSQTPVKSQFGWHVIKVEERRQAAPASFEESQDQIRQSVIQEGIQGIIKIARTGLKIEIFNPDGTPKRATDAAEPPPAPVKK